jgi:uncharacterized protein (DUF433 family)
VEQKPPEQQAIINPVVVPESFAENEYRIDRAHPIKNDRDNKIQFVRTNAQASLDYSNPPNTPSLVLARFRPCRRNYLQYVLSMDWRQYIVADPAVVVGKPVVRGTRLAVEWIAELIATGWSEDDLMRNYPGLTREQILACVEYAKERAFAGVRGASGNHLPSNPE